MQRFLVKTLLSAQLGLDTQPHYKTPGDLQVEIEQMQWLTLSMWGCPLDNGATWLQGSQTTLKKKEPKNKRCLLTLDL